MKLDLPHARVELDALGVATLTISNAGSLNILGTPVIDDLRKAFEALAADESVRVVVLRGTGDKAFVAGADIKEMGALDRASARRFIDGLRSRSAVPHAGDRTHSGVDAWRRPRTRTLLRPPDRCRLCIPGYA
jgi:enoyl-CoA hydratase/carnithine racemase